MKRFSGKDARKSKNLECVRKSVKRLSGKGARKSKNLECVRKSVKRLSGKGARKSKNLEPASDSIESGQALEAPFGARAQLLGLNGLKCQDNYRGNECAGADTEPAEMLSGSRAGGGRRMSRGTRECRACPDPAWVRHRHPRRRRAGERIRS